MKTPPPTTTTPTPPIPDSPTRSLLSCTATAGQHDYAAKQLRAARAPPRKDVVRLSIIVKETEKKLCTLFLPQETTLARVRSEIVDKNLEKIKTNLFVSEQQCRPRLVVIWHRGEECEDPDIKKLAHLEMLNGNDCDLTVRFVRALGFLSKAKIESIIEEIAVKTKGMYPRELTMQAINMAPRCTLD